MFMVAQYAGATFHADYPASLLMRTGAGGGFGWSGYPSGTYWYNFSVTNSNHKNGASYSLATAGTGPMNAFAAYAMGFTTPASYSVYAGLDAATGARWWIGDIASGAVFPANLAAPLRRRVEQSLARSFKLPCS